ncbi:hypothetical protein HNR23_002359 [Nocardiopsis mwathae]|uniref:Uncharacterized protein n=1 Tax=Nocardiopsis mwathae TaxID=1472723 RepID=A0A7W9YHK2_9ACTN|nr:hypothetical protein [Nocardiopsis mwathae]MBB6172299.1 hypothetical protein [Nocardiopsis mwathae]
MGARQRWSGLRRATLGLLVLLAAARVVARGRSPVPRPPAKDAPAPRGGPGGAGRGWGLAVLSWNGWLVVALVAATGYVFSLGQEMYRNGAQEPPVPPSNPGWLLFYTTDPDAEPVVAITVHGEKGTGAHDDGAAPPQAWLDLTVVPDTGRDHHWALVFDRVLLPESRRLHEAGSYCETAGPDDRIWHSSGLAAVWSEVVGFREPHGAFSQGTVIVGRPEPNDPPSLGPAATGDALLPEYCLRVPVDQGIVSPTPAQYLVQSPVMGMPREKRYPEWSQPDLRPRSDEFTDLLLDEDAPLRLADDTLYRVRITDHVGHMLSEAPMDPLSVSDWTWEGTGSLEMRALISRPAQQAQQQRDMFWAGVLLSGASALLLWTVELTFGPERRPLLARRPPGG